MIRDSVERIVSTNGSKRFLQDIMDDIRTEDDLIHFFHRYTFFNGNFAGGVASLAGAFHVRQDLFRDAESHISECADRSAEIASQIFFAAEDEYAFRTGTRVTHRYMAQRLLEAILSYAAVPQATFADRFKIGTHTLGIVQEVIRGYRVNVANSEDEILAGLGFHIGAELLADQEFDIIDSFLNARFLNLVRFLKGNQEQYGADSYRWIELHCAVEIEHADHAFDAADLALKYYSGRKTHEAVTNVIVSGFADFAALQRRFFQNILGAN